MPRRILALAAGVSLLAGCTSSNSPSGSADSYASVLLPSIVSPFGIYLARGSSGSSSPSRCR